MIYFLITTAALIALILALMHLGDLWWRRTALRRLSEWGYCPDRLLASWARESLYVRVGFGLIAIVYWAFVTKEIEIATSAEIRQRCDEEPALDSVRHSIVRCVAR